MKQTRLSLCIAFALALTSCAALKPEAPAPEPVAPVKPAPVPTAPISAESLYNLLVAELAGKSDRPDIALGNYLQEAHKTRDPGVAERATQIARYLGAHQASLDAASLWVEVAPDSIPAKQTLIVELIHAKRSGEAQPYLMSLADKPQQNVFEALVVNNRFVSSDERKNLLEGIKKINEAHPNNADAWFARALLHEQERDLNATLDALDKAVKADPTHVSAVVAQGKMFLAMKQPERAEEILEKAVAKNPDNKRVRLAYVQSLIAQQKMKDARKQFDALIDQNPEDADLILSFAAITFESEMYEDTERYSQKLLKLGQHESEAQLYLARCAQLQKHDAEAVKYYLAIPPGPQFTAARTQAAVILFEMDKKNDARGFLREGRALMPEASEQLFVTEGELLVQDKQTKEAFNLLTDGLSQLPSDPNLLYSRAMVAEKLDKLDIMEQDLRQVLSANPNNSTAMNALGYTLADRTTRYAEALDLIQKAYQISPQDPAILDSMGWIQYRLGDPVKALDYLRKAYEKMKDQEVAAHLGEVLWTVGKQDEAKTIWNEALVRQPDGESLQKTMKRFIK